ncbi:hypothetical protein LTR17_018343 [Elasticomyces elasticus]|nr:hypothetical protein LTR17_018343 [Elasticomyces elasticus]
MAPVIVFGPTGNIGSVAARTAEKHGAKVYLAMRDTKKTIPGLTPEHEEAGNFTRVEADLTKPETIAAAIKESGAKRAFVYLARTPDGMKATLSAMKSSGIDFIVFLSSFNIALAGPELNDIQPSELIPYMHAQVELSLLEVLGTEGFVAVRPGGFATNTLRWKSGILAGEVQMYSPSFPADCITPNDMGEVSGTILVSGPKQDQHIVYLYGPQMLTQGDATKVAGRVLGKDVTLTSQNAEEALEQMVQTFGSAPLAEYLMRAYKAAEGRSGQLPHYDEGVENVALYTGRPATKFEDWVEANKEVFTA